jgi:hypothetical protein
VEDVNIGKAAQLCLNLFLGRNFVTDQTDDKVLFVAGDLLDKLELDPLG